MERQRLNRPKPSARTGRSVGRVALGLALALAMGGAGSGWANPNPLAEPIPLEGPAGQRLLLGASASADHGPLAQWFETQANLAYCGVASAVMALNSLAVPAPPVPGYGAYRF